MSRTSSSRSSVDPETVRRSGELLERQSSHLTHLVDDLLDVGRIMRGRVALDREPLPLGAVVDTAIETVRSLARSQNARRCRSGALNRLCR